MKHEAQPVTKVMISDQITTDLHKVKMEGVKLLFTCLRISERLNPEQENFDIFRAVAEAKHIAAEAIGAKECTCNMCMCEVLADNSLLSGRGH